MPVSSPFVNATVGTPFSVIAGCNVSGADAIQIYLDSSLVYSANATSVNYNLSAGAGSHQLEVMCWVGRTPYSSGVFGITVAPQTGTNQVLVSSPLPSSTVGTTFSAIASCNVAGADAMQVYMDSSLVYEENAYVNALQLKRQYREPSARSEVLAGRHPVFFRRYINLQWARKGGRVRWSYLRLLPVRGRRRLLM